MIFVYFIQFMHQLGTLTAITYQQAVCYSWIKCCTAFACF